MNHFFTAITNTSGDSLVGYFARVIDPATQNTVTISSDNNGTPIVVVSGVDNMAKTDAYGNISLYVAPGTYHLDIYAPNATSFLYRVENVGMASAQGEQGEPGPTGPSQMSIGLFSAAAAADIPTEIERVFTTGRTVRAKRAESFTVSPDQTTGANALRFQSANGLWYELDYILQTVELRDYYTANGGVLKYVSSFDALTYAARQLTPDITTALQAAINAAGDLFDINGTKAEVRIPAGVYTLSGPINLRNGVSLRGAGKGITGAATHLRRTANYGTAFYGNQDGMPGSFVSEIRISDMRLYVDHGRAGFGFENPPAASFINKATGGAWFDLRYPRDSVLVNLSIWGMPYHVVHFGGIQVDYIDIDSHSIFDPLSVARQESLKVFVLDGSLSEGIPSHCTITNWQMSGEKETVVVSYPGGGTVTTSINQGSAIGVELNCFEVLDVMGLYIQGCAGSDLVFSAKPNTIMQSAKFVNCGFDPCGVGVTDAAIKFEDAGITSSTPTAISFSSCHILFQGNGFRGISDITTTSGKYSVCGLTWTGGELSTFVGNAARLERSTHTVFDCSIRAFNIYNFYDGDDAAGIVIGPESGPVMVNGIIGGTSGGSPTGSNCETGVRYLGTARGVVTVGALNGGCIDLFTINGDIMDRLTGDGSVGIIPSVSQGFDIRAQPQCALIDGVVPGGGITITLPTAGVPNGYEQQFIRTANSTGGTVSIAGLPGLGTPSTSVMFKYFKAATAWVLIDRPDVV